MANLLPQTANFASRAPTCPMMGRGWGDEVCKPVGLVDVAGLWPGVSKVKCKKPAVEGFQGAIGNVIRGYKQHGAGCATLLLVCFTMNPVCLVPFAGCALTNELLRDGALESAERDLDKALRRCEEDCCD